MARNHPTSPDRQKNRKVSEDDRFVAGVLEASGWAKQNQDKLVMAGIGLAVLLAVGWFMATERSRTMEQAMIELEQVTSQAEFGVPEQAKAQLSQYLERYGGTPYADEARLHLATLHLQTGQSALALAVLEEAGSDARDPLGAQVLTLRGRAYEAQGQFEEAARSYLRLAETAEISFQIRSGLEDAARMRTEMGDFAGAAELYVELQEGLVPSDPQLGIYRMREEEMRHRAKG